MPDLTSALRALLHEVRESTKHTGTCNSHDFYPYLAKPGGVDYPCDCDWQARVDAEIVRRWVASIEAAILLLSAWDDKKASGTDAYAAALHAAHAARTAPEEE